MEGDGDNVLKFGRGWSLTVATAICGKSHTFRGGGQAITLSAEQMKPVPDFSSSFDTKYITGLGAVEDRMLILVDIEKLMGGSDMALMEQATGQ